MNASMNDWEELRERAERDEEEVRRTGVPVITVSQRRPSTLSPDNRAARQTVSEQIQARMEDLREQAEAHFPPPTVPITAEASSGETWDELRRIARENPVRVLMICGGCSQTFDPQDGCPCGHQDRRDEDLRVQAHDAVDRFNVTFPEAAAFVQEVAGRAHGFSIGGTVSGRFSANTQNLSNIPRADSESETRAALGQIQNIRRHGGQYSEAMADGMETHLLEQMQRQAAQPGSYMRRDHTPTCPCLACSHRRHAGRPTVNIACDDCGNHFNLNPALCADGHYVCRACRDARGEPNVPEQRQERCTSCNNTRVVAIRNQQGQAFCPDCVSVGRHRPTAAAGPYVYQVACRHCQARTTFGTLALASRSLRDMNGTCVSCGHYALGIEERRANDPRLDAERERERRLTATRALIATETARARIPEPTRPTFTSSDPPESADDRRRRIRRGQLENMLRMASVTGKDVTEARRELADLDREDAPVESFVVRRKVDLD